jgi:hypothetical protein
MEDEKGEGKVGDRGEGCRGIHKEEILELSNKVTLSLSLMFEIDRIEALSNKNVGYLNFQKLAKQIIIDDSNFLVLKVYFSHLNLQFGPPALEARFSFLLQTRKFYHTFQTSGRPIH